MGSRIKKSVDSKSFAMFEWKEVKLMFIDPLDFLVRYINLTLLKYKIIKLIFS